MSVGEETQSPEVHLDSAEAEAERRARGAASRSDVFRFWDGERERTADPLVIQRALIRAAPGGTSDAIDEAMAVIFPPATGNSSGRTNGATPPTPKTADYYDAVDVLTEVIQAGFGCRPYNEETGHGLLVRDQIALLNRFLLWTAARNPTVTASPSSPAGEPEASESSPTA